MPGYRKGTPGYYAQQAKYHKTMLSKFNSEEEMKQYYRTIAAKGGRNGHTGGFADDPERARVAGRKGGAISSRAENKSSLEVRRKQYEVKYGKRH